MRARGMTAVLNTQEGEFVEPITTFKTISTTTTTTETPSTTPGEAGPCQEGWSHLGEGCYQVVTDR